ncbi:MAG: hypothetical protein B7Y99_04210 [Caulobacterales bacterium 32-69-10]|nr:MAG: hypothetical protein B7Y99_04210 [Caulobacterales bacterium 32-69-10]
MAACGAQPYPEPSEAPPPPPPPSELMGEPTPPPPPPPSDAYQPAEGQPYQPSGPVIIAMAPIPNPPEPTRPPRRVRQRVESAPTYRYVEPARPRAAAPARPAYQSGAVAPRPVAKAAPQPAPQKIAPKGSVAKVAPPPKLTTPAVPKLGAAPALKTPATPAGNANTPLGDRATRLAALEMSLAEAVANGAKLTVPTLTADQPADVTLTLPAEFGQAVRDEAAKNQLSDAAAAVNITSVLSGDGFAVTPDATQSQPLVAGTPTEFHWSVTAAQPDAKNLHADVGADLIGAGSDRLNLGSVTSSSGGFKLTPRVLGAGILILIAALVVAGLARSRGGPSRSASARRNARRARQEPRPVTLSENEI